MFRIPVRTLIASITPVALAAPSLAQCAEYDPRFGGFDGRVEAVAVFDDGSGPALYIGGEFQRANGVDAPRIARWNGTSWSALGPPGSGMNAPVHDLVVFDDGSGPALYAAGNFTTAGGVPCSHVAKWDGASWSPLGAGTGGSVNVLAVFDDGSGPALYAGGVFTPAVGGVANRIARWDGVSWTALGSGLSSGVHSLAVFDDGSGPALYAGGFFLTAGGVPASQVARWDGAVWSALGTGTNNLVSALAVYDDGSGPALYAGGAFTTAGGVPAPRVARWDGASWSAVGAPGSGPSASIQDLAVFDDGSGPKLFAGGSYFNSGDLPLRAWDGATWSAPSSPGGINNTVHCLGVFDNGSGPVLVAGGDFEIAGGVAAVSVASWNGATWSAFGTPAAGLSLIADVLTVFDDGSGPALIAGGYFSAAGGVAAARIAAWDGASWSALGAGISGGVEALGVFDDGSGPALYVGGNFSAAGGVSASHIARWDGANWSALGVPGSGADDWVLCMTVFDDGTGPALYVGGRFTSVGGVAADRIARWDGTSWTAVGGIAGTYVFALEVFDDGSGPALYAAGVFSTAGGVAASNVARWDGANWSALGAPSQGTDGVVYALEVYDDGSGPALYAGGQFQTAGGLPAGNVARWNGTSWSALGAIGQASNSVGALTVFDDGFGPALYAGGLFGTAGGVAAKNIARWDGTSWGALGAGTTNTVRTLAVYDDGADGDADLYLGGAFITAGGISSTYIAQWHGCPRGPVAHCFGDGSVAACPCANDGLPGRGCDNSSASGGALLTHSGTTTPDALVLTQQGELASSLSIFLQGSVDLPSPAVFGDGLRCAGGALKRLYVKSAVLGMVSAPGPGDPSITAQSALLGDPIGPGTTREYQVYYRDPAPGFCPSPQGSSFNVGNALRVAW